MKTDINRLHKVISRKIDYRGCGKTFAACHELAGAIEVNDDRTILGVIKYIRDFSHIFNILESILYEHNIKILEVDKIKMMIAVEVNGIYKIIEFITEEHFNSGYGTIGRENDLIVNFVDYLQFNES